MAAAKRDYRAAPVKPFRWHEVQMMIFLTKVRRFFSENYTFILAISSVLIAACSLFFTISAQRSDLYYKESLIRPYFAWHVDAQDLTVKLVNDGLGPGVIKNVAWRMQGQCFVSNPKNPIEWHTNRQNFENFINIYFLDEVIGDASVWKVIGTRPATISEIPTPNQMLAAGKEIVVFGIAPEQVQSFRADLAKFPEQTNAAVRERFARRATMFPMMVQYCSATGRFCAATEVMGDIVGCR
jgi:hypothetical protein